MIGTVSTSAEAPILYGRFRPMSGERPTGTDRCRAIRPLRSPRQSTFGGSDYIIGGWDQGVGPPSFCLGRPKDLRQEACMDSTVTWSTRSGRRGDRNRLRAYSIRKLPRPELV